jgi:hypothetical protein
LFSGSIPPDFHSYAAKRIAFPTWGSNKKGAVLTPRLSQISFVTFNAQVERTSCTLAASVRLVKKKPKANFLLFIIAGA